MVTIIDRTTDIADEKATFAIAAITTIAYGNHRVYINPYPSDNLRYTVTLLLSNGTEIALGRFHKLTHAMGYAKAAECYRAENQEVSSEWQR